MTVLLLVGRQEAAFTIGKEGFSKKDENQRLKKSCVHFYQNHNTIIVKIKFWVKKLNPQFVLVNKYFHICITSTPYRIYS